MLYLLASRVFLLAVSAPAPGAQLPTEGEVKANLKESLQQNVQGSCRWSFLTEAEDGGKRDVIRVTHQRDREMDAAEWAQLSAANASSLTMANSELSAGMYEGTSEAMQNWRDSKRMHFAVPRTHPRNTQRPLCLALAAEAATRPVQPYMPSYTAPYLLHARRALVNSLGVVALECGYFQAHESCLTNIRSSGAAWRRACNAFVPREQWGSLFSTPLVSRLKLARFNLSLPQHRALHKCMFEARHLSPLHPYRISDPRRVKRVLLATAAWDYNYHHLLFESALRFFPHLAFLQANPDVMVHFQAEELLFRGHPFCSACRRMREDLLEFFNISRHRIVRGVVAADEVWIPRGVGCSAPTQHALELRHLAKAMLATAHGLGPADVSHRTLAEVHNLLAARRRRSGGSGQQMQMQEQPRQRPVILVQDRRCIDRPPNGSSAYPTPAPTPSLLLPEDGNNTTAVEHLFFCSERSWNATFFASFLSSLQATFGQSHEIRVHNGSYLDCFACQIRDHAEADIVVGHHGAGLTNAMFMRPGSVLLEIAGFWDGRILPLCGHYGPYASVFGVHHYIFSFDSYGKFMTFQAADLWAGFAAFYTRLRPP